MINALMLIQYSRLEQQSLLDRNFDHVLVNQTQIARPVYRFILIAYNGWENYFTAFNLLVMWYAIFLRKQFMRRDYQKYQLYLGTHCSRGVFDKRKFKKCENFVAWNMDGVSSWHIFWTYRYHSNSRLNGFQFSKDSTVSNQKNLVSISAQDTFVGQRLVLLSSLTSFVLRVVHPQVMLLR
jgi:hypothetical protein